MGAGGLVGAAVVERLAQSCQVVPVVHSWGGAWQVARLGVDLRQADVADRGQLLTAMDGCTHVVNCVGGSAHAVTAATRSVLAVCTTLPIERLVHLSSVEVYGDPPRLGSESEEAPPRPVRGSEAQVRAQLDVMVEEAVDQGVRAVTLCLPDVSGPRSPFLLDVLAAMRAGTFALVDGGRAPAMLADAANVAHAAWLALDSDVYDGKRMFVHNGCEATWAEIAEALAPLAGGGELPEVGLDEAVGLVGGGGQSSVRARLGTLRRIAGLAPVRRALKEDRALSRELRSLRSRFESLPVWATRPLSNLLDAPTASLDHPPYEIRFLKHQLRGVRHRLDKAQRELGYEPAHDTRASLSAFVAWYTAVTGYGGDLWDLGQELQR